MTTLNPTPAPEWEGKLPLIMEGGNYQSLMVKYGKEYSCAAKQFAVGVKSLLRKIYPSVVGRTSEEVQSEAFGQYSILRNNDFDVESSSIEAGAYNSRDFFEMLYRGQLPV
jgi:hypothetical protein